MRTVNTSDPTQLPPGRLFEAREALRERYGRRITARLTELSSQVTPDVQERLRFAREQALARAHEVRVAAAPAAVTGRSGSSAVLGGGPRWWTRLAAVLPLVVLVGGFMLIVQRYDRAQIEAAADIDTAILTDNLPPDAYSDPGFAEFLKSPPQE